MNNPSAFQRKEPVLVRLRHKYRTRYDAAAMLVYLSICFVWGLFAYPVGRDFAAMADPLANMARTAAAFFVYEMLLFGDSVMAYRLVNMALLFGCMAAVYAFVNFALRGPLWLGILAATLFMANPIHTEAVMNISGAGDLLPAFFALVALAFYGANVYAPAGRRLLISLMAFTIAVFPFEQNMFLFLVILLYEYMVPAETSKYPRRALPFVILGLIALGVHHGALAAHSWDAAQFAGPLYLILYPLGFLPETVARFHAQPLLGWLAAAAVAGCVYLIHRKAQRSVILFGLLAMLILRLYHDGRAVDLVHMVGGGQLLVETALFNLALVALFYRIMDHPKWRPIIVWSTTTLCIVFFALQIRATYTWTQAGGAVRAFQAEARQTAPPDEELGVMPDYQYYQGAPMMLSDSIAHDTPFSDAIAHQPLLPLHYRPADDMTIEIVSWSSTEGRVRVSGVAPVEVIPRPSDVLAGEWSTDAARVRWEGGEDNSFDLVVTPLDEPLPETLLPGGQPGTEE